MELKCSDNLPLSRKMVIFLINIRSFYKSRMKVVVSRVNSRRILQFG